MSVRVGLPAPVVGVAIAAGLVVVAHLLVVATGNVPGWIFAKPVALVELLERTGHLNTNPFPDAGTWYRESINAFAPRFVPTVLFDAASEYSGIPVGELAGSVVGVPFLMLTSWYLVRAFREPADALAPWLAVQVAMLLNYQELVYAYHSGGWPGLSLLMLFIGSLARSLSGQADRRLYAMLAILFLYLNFQTYHTTASMSLVFISVASGLTIIGAAVSRVGAIEAPMIVVSVATYLGLAIGFLYFDPLFSFYVKGAAPALADPVGVFVRFFSDLTTSTGLFGSRLAGFAWSARIAIMAPLAFCLLIGAPAALRRAQLIGQSRRVSTSDIFELALYVTGGTLLVVLFLFGAGTLRPTESYVFSILGAVLLWTEPRARSGRAASLVPMGLMVITTLSLLVVIGDPMVARARVSPDQAAAVRWAGDTRPYPLFADAKYTNLILSRDPEAVLVDFHLNPTSVVRWEPVLYGDACAFADGVRAAGGRYALLAADNLGPRGVLMTVDWPIVGVATDVVGGNQLAPIFDAGSVRVYRVTACQR